MNKSLKKWIKDNNLTVDVLSDNIIEIKDFGKFLIVSEKEFTFDERYILHLTDDEIDVLSTDVEYLLFKFGSFWFYHHKDSDTELNFFRYLGKPDKDSYNLPFLGVHGRYELCNGSRGYDDWVNKAKFLGYKSIGICEHQTLAGSHYFQKACDKGDIKAIHGRTNKVKSENGSFYYIKTYVKNRNGWKNLLKIHNKEIIERDGEGNYITESEFKKLSDDLITIFSFDTDLNAVNLDCYNLDETFFQFNILEFESSNRDEKNLLNHQNYLDNFYPKVKPIILRDCYYLDKGDHPIKFTLNRIINRFTQFRSQGEYLQPFEQLLSELYAYFKDLSKCDEIIEKSFEAYGKIESECNFKIKRDGMHLPEYIMNDDEKKLYKNNEDMFFTLVEKGFNEKIKGKVDNEIEYLERIENEIEVLKEGGVLDYFLILYDVFNFMRREIGISALGRGSAAGSLVSFLLNIVQIDPLKYGLLFERFLSRERLMAGSLPDIDSDIPSSYRQQVIDYVIDKYGKDNVAMIGTAQSFKLKSGMKDLLKMKGVENKEANILTSIITVEDNIYNFDRLFEVAYRESKIKAIIDKHPDIVYLIYLMHNQPRSLGIHAAGVVIFPKTDQYGNKTTAADYIPLRYSNDQLVTEWEKDAVEEEGFLKADLLGLAQLDKIVRMNELIRQNNKKYKDFQDIDLEDSRVLDLFKSATTEDVFQFNTDVQKAYLLELQPERVEDLIAANALNRPGAMETGTHLKYINIKNGEEQEDFVPLIDDLLVETRSLLVYQEQVIFAFQRLTQCDFAEAEDFRRTLTKAKPGQINPNFENYKERFIKAYIEKNIEEEKAREIWDKIQAFSHYSFNKSHAAAYAITGYWAAYYKAYFPLEFYTSSLEFADSKLLPRLTSEIFSSNLINLNPPEINKSSWQYTTDAQTNSIYWSLISIKQAGEKSVQTLIEERDKNGKYFSFEEFVERAKNTKVNRRVILHFILCGCFDEIENIQEPKDRLRLIKQYSEILKDPKIYSDIAGEVNHTHNFYWLLRQKQLCGLGVIGYSNILKKNRHRMNFLTEKFYDGYMLQEEQSVGKIVIVAGILKEIRERNTRNGAMCQILLDSNDEQVYVVVWPEAYEKYKQQIEESQNQPVFINGIVARDGFKKINVIQTTQRTKIYNL